MTPSRMITNALSLSSEILSYVDIYANRDERREREALNYYLLRDDRHHHHHRSCLIIFQTFSLSLSQISGQSSEDNYVFDNFDQVDEAAVQRGSDESASLLSDKSAINFPSSPQSDTLDYASKDLLNRLLEKNPQYRLKSIMALGRIAFFHNFNFEDVKHRKVRKLTLTTSF